MKNHLLKYLFFTLFNLLYGILLLNAHTETISGFTQHETVNWLGGRRSHALTGTEAEKEEAFSKLKKSAFWNVFPDHLKEAVEQNRKDFEIDAGGNRWFIQSSNTFVMYSSSFKCYYVMPAIKLLSFVGAPERTPAVDPKTGKYYVVPPKNTIAKLTGDELTYIKKLTEQVNRNIHYLGSSPIPRLDPQKMERGEYLFTAILPLTFGNLNVAFKPSVVETYYNNRSKSEIMALYGLSDEVDLEIAKRLRAPLYHPELVDPQARYRSKMGGNCHGIPVGNTGLFYVIFLGSSRFLNPKKKDRSYESVYGEYFWRIVDGSQKFRQGLEAELASVSKTDARYPAIKSIVTRADRIMERIETQARQYQLTDEIHKKLPYSMLDPSGKHLKRFLEQQKKLRESQEKQNKETPKDISKIAFPRLSRAA